MSIITALRAPGRRSARRSSVSTRRAVDSRINRAAKAVVERLEGRTLLDGLPYGVSVSPDAVYSFTGDATNGYALTLSAGAESIDANLGAGGVPFSLTLTGTANVSINSPEIFTALTLSGTAKATVSSSGGGATGNLLDITGTSGFSMPLTGTAPTATLDLMDNDMILRGAGSGELPVLQALLKSGKTGPGLKSSDAAASPSSEKTALGYSCGLASLDGLTTINGQAVSAMDCFVKYTLSGDANLSGKVDNADLTALSNHWGQTSGAYWQQGDFSLDGKVTNVDYALLQNNYQNSINGPNFNRTLLPVGLPITTVEGQPFSGALATFTDTQNPAGGQANVGNYTASVSWGNNSFVPATVT
ncbi:MAG: hypothetical protein JWN24_1767, partial [Phycisphaerales bacterium]|nr:hypothetical protein [Phycisphaerales bacterium]